MTSTIHDEVDEDNEDADVDDGDETAPITHPAKHDKHLIARFLNQ